MPPDLQSPPQQATPQSPQFGNMAGMGDMDEQEKLPHEKLLDPENDPELESKRSSVKMWLSRIEGAKKKWAPAFKRMAENAKFAAGVQRTAQATLETEKYIANITLRNVNQKVASLYARNPIAEFQARKRLYFQVWDEKIESIMPIAQKLAMGMPPMPQEMPLIFDYLQGTKAKADIAKIGQTLEILYQYYIDEHDPDFKLQMKSLIRRVCTCGVGYVGINFTRDSKSPMLSGGPDDTVFTRAQKAALIADELEEKTDEQSPRHEQLKSLLASLQISMSEPEIEGSIEEKLVFDWLAPTAVIPDENCTNLKGFINCKFIAIEYVLPVEDVNAFFGCDIKLGGDLKVVGTDGKTSQVQNQSKEDALQSPRCHLYRLLNKVDKSEMWLVDGHKDYVKEPEPLKPAVRGFWPIQALCFNDVETLPDNNITVFPPSDVELIKHQQKERNRIREELRKHRNANAPKYVTQAGWLTAADKEKLMNYDSNTVVELQGSIPGGDVSKALAPMVHPAIDPACYDAAPIDQDILMCIGSQEANIGPVNPKGTATGQSIAEQSRNIGISSNVDDLDDCLSWLAGAGGELMLQELSPETVKHIAGPGAHWPEQDRIDYLNALYLRHKAASNGRPNKVVDIQNWQQLGPLLMQAGANPQFMVRETIRRLDDQLDPELAFPLQIAAQQGQEMAAQQAGQPPQQRNAEQPPPKQARPGPGPQQKPPGRPGLVAGPRPQFRPNGR